MGGGEPGEECQEASLCTCCIRGRKILAVKIKEGSFCIYRFTVNLGYVAGIRGVIFLG